MIKIYESDSLMYFANVRGINIKTDDVNFSFYFSSNNGDPQGISVQICWINNKISNSLIDGYMNLHGDYEYVQSSKKHIDEENISNAREFFKKYKVLFSAVWEEKLQEDTVQDYFRNMLQIEDICNELNIKADIKTIDELEMYVRSNNLFNMND